MLHCNSSFFYIYSSLLIDWKITRAIHVVTSYLDSGCFILFLFLLLFDIVMEGLLVWTIKTVTRTQRMKGTHHQFQLMVGDC
jgi:hypothetical protein